TILRGLATPGSLTSGTRGVAFDPHPRRSTSKFPARPRLACHCRAHTHPPFPTGNGGQSRRKAVGLEPARWSNSTRRQAAASRPATRSGYRSAVATCSQATAAGWAAGAIATAGGTAWVWPFRVTVFVTLLMTTVLWTLLSAGLFVGSTRARHF